MKKLLSWVVLVLAGCSSGGEVAGTHDAAVRDAATGAAALIGKWIGDLGGAGMGISFDGINYTTQLVAPLLDGTYGLQRASGTYSVQGSDTVVMVKTSSSCQGSKFGVTKLGSATFSRQGNHLTFTIDSTTVVALDLSTSDPTGTGVAKIGCFSSDGSSFQVNPVTPVP